MQSKLDESVTRKALEIGSCAAMEERPWKSVSEFSETSQELSGTFAKIPKFQMFLDEAGDRRRRGRWKTVLDASKTFEMFSNIQKLLDDPRMSGRPFSQWSVEERLRRCLRRSSKTSRFGSGMAVRLRGGVRKASASYGVHVATCTRR